MAEQGRSESSYSGPGEPTTRPSSTSSTPRPSARVVPVEEKPVVRHEALIVEEPEEPDKWLLLCKLSYGDTIESTRYMNLPNGCLVRVSTVKGNSVLAESVTFVPGNTF